MSIKVSKVSQQTLAEKKPKLKYEIQTSKGKFQIELFPRKAPITVENFIRYVESGHYVGTIFQRVIKDFMIQGGSFTADMTKKRTFKPIKNEASNGLKNEKGTIAMARTDDPDSAKDQFFINLVNNSRLNQTKHDAGYCVFGKVTKGFDVIKKIGKVDVDSNHLPKEPVTLLKIVPI